MSVSSSEHLRSKIPAPLLRMIQSPPLNQRSCPGPGPRLAAVSWLISAPRCGQLPGASLVREEARRAVGGGGPARAGRADAGGRAGPTALPGGGAHPSQRPLSPRLTETPGARSRVTPSKCCYGKDASPQGPRRSPKHLPGHHHPQVRGPE